jgi:DNA helicase HerA-like ATPase
MGMSSHVTGVRDLDGKFAKMMEAKLACEAAGVGYPDEVKEYFKYPEESAEYLKREMEEVQLWGSVTEYSRDATDGFEVDLSKLPEGVKSIRFENSY